MFVFVYTGVYDASESSYVTTVPQMAPTSVRDQLPDDQAYEGLRNPYVLVINNVNFIKDPVPRNGAERDLENVETFFREAGFTSVRKDYDLPKHKMVDILDETRKRSELGKWPHTDFLPAT